MRHNRKDLVHHVLAAVHAVYKRLSVVVAERALQNAAFAGVNLKRRGKRALNRLDCRDHRGGFVNAGKPHVYVQNLCARVDLAFRFVQDKVHVAGEQGFLALFLSRGIDAFAHDLRTSLAANLHGLIVRADKSV